MKNIIVTIDGPCCSGKSTIAELLAADLGFKYIDTGILYRAFTYVCLQDGENLKDKDFEKYVTDTIKKISFDGRNVFIDHKKIDDALIKNEKHALVTSEFAESKIIRDTLTSLIRDISEGESVVTDGRDCGTNIFPEADYKFYLDISTECRLKRWISSCSHQVTQEEIEQGRKNIDARDFRDKNRDYCPLRMTQDMIAFNLEDMSSQDVVSKMKKSILVGESAVYMKKTSKQIRQGKTKLKRVRFWRNLFSGNVFKIENTESNKLVLGHGTMRDSMITIYGTGNYVEIKDGYDIVNLKILVRGNNNSIIIGEDFVVNYNTNAGAVNISAKDDNNSIVIGEYAHIRGEAELVCMEGTKLTIGDNFGMSSETIIRTGDGHRIFDKDTGVRTNNALDIVIGNDCWIARRGIVLKGVVLKDYTILGTGALVTKKYDESNIILGGNPARVIKRNITWLPGRR